MFSPTRSFCIHLLSVLVFILSASFLQAQPPKKPSLSPEKQKLLKDRDRLYTQARKLIFQDLRYSEGMAALQRVLTIEKKLYGPLHEKVASRLKMIGQYYRQLENWKAARQALDEMVNIHTRKHGKNHWKTQDAHRAVKDLEFQQTLKPELLQQLRQANQLNHQVFQLWQAGQSRKAIPPAKKTIEIRKQILGEKHPLYASSLFNLAAQYKALGRYKEAESLYVQAVTLQKEVLGEKHPKYAQSLDNLAMLYKSQGEYSKALPFQQQAMALQKELLGDKHPDYIVSLNNLAVLYRSRGLYSKAETAFKQALALRKEVLGEKHPHYAMSLTNLAVLFKSQGRYSEAEPLIKQALAINKESLGGKHPDYASSLSRLAGLYHSQGKYSRAEPLYQQALALRKEVLGEKHPDYANSVNNLAGLYLAQTHYSKAEPLYRQALALKKEILGEKHPDYATVLNNLAELYRYQGQYNKALRLHQKALALKKGLLGEKHPDYANSLYNLALLYRVQGQFSKAEPLLKQSLELRKELLGEKHPDYVGSLMGLAAVYHFRRQHNKALPLYQQALVLRKEILGDKHPGYATSLNHLASLFSVTGKHRKALRLYHQALVLRKKVLGEKHPEYAESLNNLGFFYYTRGNYKQSEFFFLKEAEAFQAHRSLTSQENLARASYSNEHSRSDFLVGVLATNRKYRQAWYWLEQSLGRATFDEIVARNTRTDQEQRQLDQLQGIIQQTETRLTKLTSQPELSEDQKQLQQRWISEQSKNYTGLAELFKQFEEKYGITEGKSYSLKQIQSALAENAAFLTWIDYFKEHWVVLVRSKGNPVFQRMKTNKKGWTKEDSVLPAKLYALLQNQRETNPGGRERLIQQLRQQRIAPIAKHLQDIEHVIILPSRLMDKIPSELLLPEKKVSHAPSATMYAYLQQQKQPKSTRLLALGDPIFNLQEELKEKPLPNGGILITSLVVGSIADQAKLEANQVLLAYDDIPVNNIEDLQKAMANAQGKKEVRIKVWQEGRIFERVIPTGKLGVVLSKEPAKIALKNRRKQYWQLASRGDTWNALPGTRIEVVSIAELMNKDQRQVLFDSEASEQQLHQLASNDKLKDYKYLHFATHGQVNSFLPMQSALILSRDNLKANITELKANEPYFDGRLTAKEVALNWTLDADLVTLSACNSGLGKHAKGEGYMGFAQSFLIRGSRSVVLSLWSVDDTATALLMKRFYENLLKKKMSKIDALREAKKWLRTLSRSEVLKLTAKMTNGVARGPGRKKLPAMSTVPMTNKKEDAPYAHPYYWSAFILIGDPH